MWRSRTALGTSVNSRLAAEAAINWTIRTYVGPVLTAVVPRPTIAAARVRRDDVFAVFVDRKEREIILDPEKLLAVVTKVPR
jgi:hypothetical protein